jgi:predicted metal-dependent hydrolase
MRLSPPPGSSANDICQGKLPPEALLGLELFNQGQFFEAHEALETAWRTETGPVRELYRGILQVGVGYLHIQRGNLAGALKLFGHCRHWLEPFADECCGVNLAKLRQDFTAVESYLQQFGLIPPSLHEFYFKPIEYRNPDHE